MTILKLCAVALATASTPYGAYAEMPVQQGEARHLWGEIDMQGLDALRQANVSMKLVDARSDKWFDGILILGAQRLPSNASEGMLAKILPNKNQLVVVYCAGEGCDASQNLAKRLIEQGYKNVIDYHGGIREWIANNKPIEKI